MPSRFAYERAVRSSGLPPMSRLLALTIATWADVRTGVIPERLTPSLTTLESDTGMDRKTVRTHLDRLENGGWIRRNRPTPAAARAHKKRTRYRLEIPPDAIPGPDEEDDPAAEELGAQLPEARGADPLAEEELGAEIPQARGAAPLELGAPFPISRGTDPPTSSMSYEYQDGPGALDARPAPPPAPPQDPPTAQTITGEWLDRCRARPPKRVIGQMAKHIKELLAEEIHPDHIRRGIAAWMAKDVSPSALPGFVNQVMNVQPKNNVVQFANRQQQSDDLFDRAAARAAERERQMGIGGPA